MKEIYITGDNIISSLGFTTEENFALLESGVSGIRECTDQSLSPSPLLLSQVDNFSLEERFALMLMEMSKSNAPGSYTRLEKMMILSVYDATRNLPLDLRSPKLLFILSTTKGNIQLLEEKYRLVFDHKRVFLWELARVIASFFGFSNPPLIISNACISGVVALNMGARHLRSGKYTHAVITGGDMLSEFVIAGFQSFQSISSSPCKPYDISRDGLSLGEACGTIILSDTAPEKGPAIGVLGGAITNDANHISGPSRTGEELGMAMQVAMEESGLQPADISLISAHGTATPYNDEMESKAITCARLNAVPVNSLKGYWGHTLGAAGVIECVASARSLATGTLIGTKGFDTLGVPEPINVIKETSHTSLQTCLKTASGFGGCNAAIILQKK